MKFLAIIITVLLRQFPGASEQVQQDDWFQRWQRRVSTWGLGAVGSLIMAILPALVLAHLLLDAVQPFLFGLLWIVLAVALLLYALGRGDFQQLMAQYRSQCHTADFEGAYLGTLADLGGAEAGDDPQSFEEVHELVQRGFFYEGYQRWFPVLLYFILFGPVGALAYRLLQLCRHNFETELVTRCLFLADWIPARLLAATFTLMGDYVSSRDVLLRTLGEHSTAPGKLLATVGTAALASSPTPAPDEQAFGEFAARQNEDAGKLLTRSAVCWVALLSLFVVLG